MIKSLFEEILYIWNYLLWCHCRCISLHNISLSIDEELRKVPLDGRTEESSLLFFEELIEWISTISIDIYLGKEWKGHSEIELTYTLDRLIGLRLLPSKLCTRKSEDGKIIGTVFLPQGFESFKLRCKSTLGRRIDDEKDFSLIVSE